MSIKEEAQSIINALPEQANWDDLLKELYRQGKIEVGMSQEERLQDRLSDAQLNSLLTRLQSSSSMPDDMRNTRSYQPGNATTLGMVSGAVAVVFSIPFPPIAWVAAGVALIAGIIGSFKQEEKAWIPILLALVSLIPMVHILLEG
ncbi:MAG: hypothetical protein JXR44_07325 [Thiotrichales bacterium]|nr:hypothetical protein [Thiotrichales bacterium]